MRSMTRRLAWCLLAVLLLTGLPPGAQAQVIGVNQPNLAGIVGPAGIIYYTTASQILSNSSSVGQVFSAVIPAGYFSTSSSTNFPGTSLGSGNSSVPLHLKILGVLDTQSSPGTINLGVNFGQGTQAAGADSPATLTLVNAIVPLGSLVQAPVIIDVWLNPIATVATPNVTNSIVDTAFLMARVEFPGINASFTKQGTAGAQPATYTIYNAATISTINIASSHILNINWQFSGGGTNYLRIYRVILKQGE